MSSSGNEMEVDTEISSAVKQETEEELNLNVLASQNVIIKEDSVQLNNKDKNISKKNIVVKYLPNLDETKEGPLCVIIEDRGPGKMRISLDEDDDEKEDIKMSPEEVHKYLLEVIKEHVKDPRINQIWKQRKSELTDQFQERKEEINNDDKLEVRKYLLEIVKDPRINPILTLTKRARELSEQLQEKKEEYDNVDKQMESAFCGQMKFLCHTGILPRISTRSVGVSANFPVKPDEFQSLLKNTRAIKENLAGGKSASVTATSRARITATRRTPITATRRAPITATQRAPITATPRAPITATPRAPITATPWPHITATPRPRITATPRAPITATPIVFHLKKSPQTLNAGNKTFKPVCSASIECIDLTDETNAGTSTLHAVVHPAPLPPRPYTAAQNKSGSSLPPRPLLSVHLGEGIVLRWDVPYNLTRFKTPALTAFEIFGYQEQPNVIINNMLWKQIGTVKAMNLPMACTMCQFLVGHKYHFAVRAIDENNRYGHFSDPVSIVYTLPLKMPKN